MILCRFGRKLYQIGKENQINQLIKEGKSTLNCILVVFHRLVYAPTNDILYFSRFELSNYQKSRN